MTPERYQQINQICEEALQFAPAEQCAFVAQACGTDAELRREVESLLQFQSGLDVFLDAPALEVAARQVASEAATQTSGAATNKQATSTNPHYSSELMRDALLNDRYLLEKELGQGGFGAVWLARDQKLHNAPVVIKVLQEGCLRREDRAWFERKFKQEIKALAQIDHPGVVRALDVGELPDGRAFLVMQHVDGVTLRSLLSARPLELKRAAHLLRQIGQALTAAHRQGIVHRDLKPENIMIQTVGDEEYARLIDFGIATVLDTPETVAESTRVVGTHKYMAPEQFQGKPTAASDIYALGVIAYEMVTGECPFKADSLLLLLEQQRAGTFVKPRKLRPDLPAGAEVAIRKALSYAPNERFAQAKDFSEAFANSFREVITVADLPVVRVRRKWPLFVGIVALVLVLGLGAVWYFSRTTQPPDAPPVAVATRELNYSLRVQKDQKSAPFLLAGETFMVAGSRLQLLISSSQDGFLYVLNEGPVKTGDLPSYVVMYPEATVKEISAAVRANHLVQVPQPSKNPEQDWFRFDAEEGEEKIWLIWSEVAVPALEAVKHLANERDQGVISNAEQIRAVQQFLAANATNKPAVVKDDTSKQTKLSVSSKLLVHPLRLEHH